MMVGSKVQGYRRWSGQRFKDTDDSQVEGSRVPMLVGSRVSKGASTQK